MVIAFDAAQFSDALGKLGKPIATGAIVRPAERVWADHKNIYWESDLTVEPKNITPTPEMFDQFTHLWERNDRTIESFAKAWGPMRISRDGEQILGPKTMRLDGPNPLFRSFNKGKEPLSAWRFFSRRAYSVLKLAAGLLEGERGSDEDWISLSGKPGPILNLNEFYGMPIWSRRELTVVPEGWGWGKPFGIKELRGQIAAELSIWASRYPVTLAVEWDETPKLEIKYGGQLLAAVALQLMLTMLQERNMYSCSGCGILYRRADRRPNPGLANFCESCRTKRKAASLADKRRQEKRSKAKALFRQGLSVGEIAEQLQTGHTTIMNFLKGLLDV